LTIGAVVAVPIPTEKEARVSKSVPFLSQFDLSPKFGISPRSLYWDRPGV